MTSANLRIHEGITQKSADLAARAMFPDPDVSACCPPQCRLCTWSLSPMAWPIAACRLSVSASGVPAAACSA